MKNKNKYNNSRYAYDQNYEKKSGHKGAKITLGVAGAIGAVVVGTHFQNSATDINKLPTKEVTVTNGAPLNSIDGIIGAVDGNQLSAPVFYNLQEYLLKQNHGSATIYSGEQFMVPIVQQSHPRKL